jgi:hypothetical protein
MLERLLGHNFEHENPRGAPCKLDVRLQFRGGTSGGFIFLYGSQSQGPPSYVTDLVRAAVRQTDSWYEDFERIAREGDNKP